jgi:hypothetical protein
MRDAIFFGALFVAGLAGLYAVTDRREVAIAFTVVGFVVCILILISMIRNAWRKARLTRQ